MNQRTHIVIDSATRKGLLGIFNTDYGQFKIALPPGVELTTLAGMVFSVKKGLVPAKSFIEFRKSDPENPHGPVARADFTGRLKETVKFKPTSYN